jgi:N-acetylglucosamine-6-sulfatase
LRRVALVIGTILAGLSIALISPESQSANQDAERPNFLIIITDDQRLDTMQYMPRTQALIGDQGVTFSSAYATTPLCCPSRSSILTGLYAHNHRVHLNYNKLAFTTVVQMLGQHGYRTGLAGKYLNSYPKVNDPPLPEFDMWVSFEGIVYYDPTLNVNGTWQVIEGYQTDIFRDYAIDFIRDSTESTQPFLLIYAPSAPHLPSLPKQGDEDLFLDLPAHRPPGFNEADVSDKPAWLQERPLISNKLIKNEIDKKLLPGLQSLVAVDAAIAEIMHELEEQGVIDNTLVIFLSDNGYFWGEHRLVRGKSFAYEEAIHVPFMLRYPPLVNQPSIEDALVANIDIAPTLYDLAGVTPPYPMDGLSLVPLLTHEPGWREHLLIEGWSDKRTQPGEAPSYQAIHTGRYVYIETQGDLAEFYDLEADPGQLDNAIHQTEYTEQIKTHQRFLAEERNKIALGLTEMPDQTPVNNVVLVNGPSIVEVALAVLVFSLATASILFWMQSKSNRS